MQKRVSGMQSTGWGVTQRGPVEKVTFGQKWEGEEGGSGMASRGTANVWLPDEVAWHTEGTARRLKWLERLEEL